VLKLGLGGAYSSLRLGTGVAPGGYVVGDLSFGWAI
jgi:hypothetical protein